MRPSSQRNRRNLRSACNGRLSLNTPADWATLLPWLLDYVLAHREILLLAPLGFAGAFIYGITGFGSALVTIPIGSTLAVLLDADGGQLSVLAPPDMPPNVKKAIEGKGAGAIKGRQGRASNGSCRKVRF